MHQKVNVPTGPNQKDVLNVKNVLLVGNQTPAKPIIVLNYVYTAMDVFRLLENGKSAKNFVWTMKHIYTKKSVKISPFSI